MKADESRSALPVKHQLDHALPTVIHHPEEELPLLARWLHRAMANPTRFWGLVAGVVVVTVGLSVLGSGLTLGRATSDEAWDKLVAAKTPGDRVEIAKEFPNTPPERWALLQAATEYYTQGFDDLPANRDAALPNLKKALDLFQKVADRSPASSPQARVAALGLARTYEARNELDKAVAQYEKVAHSKTWAGTDEAREADRLARRLKTPEAVDFYKNLYAYKPSEVALPPGGVGNLPFGLPAGHPPTNGPTTPTGTNPFPFPVSGAPTTPGAGEPNPFNVPPPPPVPAAKGAAAVPGAGSLPLDPFAPSSAGGAGSDGPRIEAPRPGAAPAAPKADAPPPGLPGDVFLPPTDRKTGTPK